MKKVFFILCALAALTACDTEGLGLFQNDTSQDNTANRIKGDFGGLKLDLTITLGDATAGTKATVKNDFAVNDVVFVTITGYHASHHYLELKKTGADTWTATPKNGFNIELYNTTGTMTAVYFPYGSSLDLKTSMGAVVFEDREDHQYYYGGLFYQAENAAYEVNGGVLCGTLNLVAPNLSAGGHDDDKFIHFDITGYTDGHDYKLYQDYVTPIRFMGINEMGIVAWETGNAGAALQGYKDSGNDIISFSGLLNSSAVGNELDYQFSIIDWTDSIAYTRDAGNRTLSTSKYIGIGDISTSTWNAMEFVHMGTSGSNLYPIYWAKRNVGATADNGRASYGKYFAWGDVNGYYIEEDQWQPFPDTYPEYIFDVCTTHSFNTQPVCDVDGDGNLLPAYDGAKATMKGFWRMPTDYDCMILTSNTSKTYSAGGATLTSTIDGYEGRHFFLPAAGTLEYNAELWANYSRCTLSRTGRVLSDPELDPSDPANYIDTFNGTYWTSTKTEIMYQGNPVESPSHISLDTYLVEPDPVYRGCITLRNSALEREFTVGRPIRAVFQVPE